MDFPTCELCGKETVRLINELCSDCRDGESEIETENYSVMPVCADCGHAGQQHEHHIPRMKGHCHFPDCICTKYRPDTPHKKALNAVIGRIRYKR